MECPRDNGEAVKWGPSVCGAGPGVLRIVRCGHLDFGHGGRGEIWSLEPGTRLGD